jgi:hypothetical protein
MLTRIRQILPPIAESGNQLGQIGFEDNSSSRRKSACKFLFMRSRSLEWLKPYHELNTTTWKRTDKKGQTHEWESGTEIIEYKKGEIIEVEEMGDGNFRDVRRNVNFLIDDPSQYRLLKDDRTTDRKRC